MEVHAQIQCKATISSSETPIDQGVHYTRPEFLHRVKRTKAETINVPKGGTAGTMPLWNHCLAILKIKWII